MRTPARLTLFISGRIALVLIDRVGVEHGRAQVQRGRYGFGEVLIGAALLLVGDLSRFIAGQLLEVDGGSSVA